ncbi:MAG: sulfatase-like hydrolase/transferase, partial [Acidimicrobiia bacterium]|nr:sulfatase-like hydrolase/transferase [Acidimicrobiia bacterium]
MADNILFIYSDQHRHDVLGAAGHPVLKTPVLDDLAARGVRFTNAWCQSPICQPSRASVITGRYTHELGLFANTGSFDPMWPTMMKSLRAAGYETATIGKTHYHDLPDRATLDAVDGPYDMRSYEGFVREFGWDHVVEEYDKYVHVSRRLATPYTDHLAEHGLLDSYREQIRNVFRLTPAHWRGETSVLPQEHDLTSFIADQTIDWLESRSPQRPFTLKLAFVQPHVPLIDDPEWAAFYCDADITVPELMPPAVPNQAWGAHLA